MATGIAMRAQLVRADMGAKSAFEMSKLLDMSPNAWKAIEKGAHLPSCETILRLVDCGYDPTWLLTGRGSMHLEGAAKASA